MASYHKRIVNADDPDVRRITALRAWPKTVEQYATMMNETSEKKMVKFTSGGDRAVVQFNFFQDVHRPHAAAAKLAADRLLHLAQGPRNTHADDHLALLP